MKCQKTSPCRCTPRDDSSVSRRVTVDFPDPGGPLTISVDTCRHRHTRRSCLPARVGSVSTRLGETCHGDDFKLVASSKSGRTPRSRGVAMKYMLFTYRDPSVQLDPEQKATVPAAVAAWCDEMDTRGVRLDGHVLGPSQRRGLFGVERGRRHRPRTGLRAEPFTSPASTSSNAPTSTRPSKLPPRTRGRTSASWN